MGYTALYRQYRPLIFDQVAGQQHVTITLKNQVTGDRVAHAYLFAGTRGTGKTSTARILARAVNCPDVQEGNPCNSCEICSRALGGKLMDIIEIDAASNRGVDEIRDLREKVMYPPAEGRYRVYIVDEVHMLTAEAFNALLKTLEEPPSHVIFILATTEPHKLPATVLSRCQRFDFKRLSVRDITKLLEHVAEEAGIDIDPGALELIAGRADGAARDALSMLDKCSTFERGHLTTDRVVSVLGMAQDRLLFDISQRLLARDAAGCLMLFGGAVKDGRDVGQLFKDIIHHLRDILIAKVAPSGLADISDAKKEDLLVLAEKAEVNTLIRAVNVLSEAEAKAKWSTYPEIFLEFALVKLCEPSMDASPEGVMDRLARLEDMVLKGGTVKAVTPDRDRAPAQSIPSPAAAGNPADTCVQSAGETEKKRESGENEGIRPAKGDAAGPAEVNKVIPEEEGGIKAGSGDGNKSDKDGGAEAYENTAGQESGGTHVIDGTGNTGQRNGRPGGQEEAGRAGDRDGSEDMSRERITAAWDEVLKHLEKHRKGLFTVLKDSKPMEIKEGMLVVGCEALHGIYHDIANSKENKEALRDAVYSVTGASFDVRVDNVDGQREAEFEGLQENYSLYEEAVRIFGDDLVERLEDKDN